jgi:hypothetical protein
MSSPGARLDQHGRQKVAVRPAAAEHLAEDREAARRAISAASPPTSAPRGPSSLRWSSAEKRGPGWTSEADGRELQARRGEQRQALELGRGLAAQEAVRARAGSGELLEQLVQVARGLARDAQERAPGIVATGGRGLRLDQHLAQVDAPQRALDVLDQPQAGQGLWSSASAARRSRRASSAATPRASRNQPAVINALPKSPARARAPRPAPARSLPPPAGGGQGAHALDHVAQRRRARPALLVEHDARRLASQPSQASE